LVFERVLIAMTSQFVVNLFTSECCCKVDTLADILPKKIIMLPYLSGIQSFLLPTQGRQVANGPLRGSKEPPKATLMVDPLEAKRLAAEEWRLLQERAAFQVTFAT